MTNSELPSVVHLVQGLQHGGLERVVVDLTIAMRDRFRPTVICYDGTGPLEARLVDAGIDVVHFSRGRGVDVRLLWSLHRELRARSPEVLHVHNTTAAFYGSAASIGTRVRRIVYTEHGPPRAATPRARRLLRLLQRRVSVTVAVSASLRQWLVDERAIPPASIRVVPNGVPDSISSVRNQRESWRNRLGIEDSALVVLAVGRLVPEKRHELLVEAFAQVLPAVENARLVIVGDGPMREAIAECARRLGVDHALSLPGRIDDVRALFGEVDVLAHPSDSEACSLVILEAFAAGVATVTRPVGGNAELVTDGVEGILAAGDAGSFARALTEILRDDARRRRMGQAARSRFVGAFTLSRLVDDYARLYVGG